MWPLFSKNLGDYSTSAYKLLCSKVGLAFEAAEPKLSGFEGQNMLDFVQRVSPTTFSSQINDLKV
ncbi:hypothetical protein GGR50DRAFT_698535 [Xylaria sp. CBS 124048]|nr:hypothetical protein GGR50DRAFT_698535 [Xylaria sp. CBS 124048]